MEVKQKRRLMRTVFICFIIFTVSWSCSSECETKYFSSQLLKHLPIEGSEHLVDNYTVVVNIVVVDSTINIRPSPLANEVCRGSIFIEYLVSDNYPIRLIVEKFLDESFYWLHVDGLDFSETRIISSEEEMINLEAIVKGPVQLQGLNWSIQMKGLLITKFHKLD